MTRIMQANFVCGLNLHNLSHCDEDGIDFLTMLCQENPDFAPDVINNYQPINLRFISAEAALSTWRSDPFLWKRRKSPRAEGSVFFASPNCYSNVSFSTYSRQVDLAAQLNFIKQCAVRFDAHFAYIHLLTQQEFEESAGEMFSAIQLGIFEHSLKKGIPNACWGMVWGRPYIDLIGRSVLSTASDAIVERLSENHIYTQLSADLWDVRDDYQAYRLLREKFKNQIGRRYFWGAAEISAPKFVRK